MQSYTQPGAPAAGYGAPPAAGAPPAQSATPTLTAGMNPFKGMKRGGQQTPVQEFVGTLTGCSVGSNGFNQATSIDLQWDQIQVVNSESPYPYPQLFLPIKYSDSLSSGWGVFAESVAEVLQIDLESVDPTLLLSQTFHVCREDWHEFFTKKDPVTGAEEVIRGTVWRVLGLVQPGVTVTSAFIVKTPPPTAANTPQAPVTPVVPGVTMPIVQPATSVPATAPAGAAPAVVAAPVAGVTAEQQALKLLHGADIATFFQLALPDQIVRTDANLLNSIFNNTFVQAKIATGEVLLNADGTHTVTGM